MPAAFAADKAIEIRVKVGSTQMKVNGQASKITAPYAASGTTMIPMAVITKGLGAKLSLKDGKVVTLTLGKNKVVFTIGSKSATANGKKISLAAAPVVKNNVTFAPVKIVESLGAKTKTDSATKEIVITLAASSPAQNPNGTNNPENPGGGSAIDTDAGKSRIGDSYYQWSMNYPTGLIQDTQSESGDVLVFRDVKDEYYLGIFVKPEANALTRDEKRTALYGYMNLSETVLDKKTVTTVTYGYEKMTTKDKDGFFYEYRGLQANGNLYVTVFGKKVAKASELTAYTGLLDSFTPAFNALDPKLKDLTKIKAGFKAFKNEDYGFSVTLPKEWTANEKVSYPSYSTDGAYLYVDVTSAEAGDTLDAWKTRKMKRFEDSFAPDYRKIVQELDISWNGIPAKMVKLSYSYDTELWWEEYEIFAFKGSYRYYIEYAYKASAKSTFEPMLGSTLQSLTVNFATVEGNFGEISDDLDTADRTKLVSKTSTKYRYSLEVPEHWYGAKKDFETDEIEYSFSGGSFSIYVWEDVDNAQEVYNDLDEFYRKLLSDYPKTKMLENTTVSFAGVTAKKVVIEDKTNDSENTPMRIIYYYAYKDGKIYQVGGSYLLANGSPFVIGQLEAAIASFKFTP